MKITKYLLIFFLTINLSWTPCHASECSKEIETTISSILDNKYFKITALALGASFVTYKWFIAPAIKNCHETLLNACRSGNLFLIKLFHLLGAKQITENGEIYLNEADKNNHHPIVQYLRNILPHDKNKPFIADCMQNKLITSDNSDKSLVETSLNKKDDVHIDNHNDNTPLILTEDNPHSPITNSLILHEATNREKESYLLLQACLKGKLKKVKSLVEEGCNINVRNYRNRTPLHYACTYNYPEIVQYLIEQGADVNAIDDDGDTPLHIAFSESRTDIAEYLIKKGADLDIKNKNRRMPLENSKHQKNSITINDLIFYSADNSCTRKTCVILNCNKENLDSISYFIKEVGNINVQGKYGDTLLHHACKNNYPEIMKYLISNNADIDAMNNSGETPLHIACTLGKLDIIQLLVENKANINAQNNRDETPLHYACRGNHLEIVQYLIEQGADVNKEGLYSDSVLQLAEDYRHESIVSFLILHGATNNEGRSGLLLACHKGNLEIIKSLVKKGCDINIQDSNGDTPLHLACRAGAHFEVIKYLIDIGASLEIANNENETAYKLIGDNDLSYYHQLRIASSNNVISEKRWLLQSNAEQQYWLPKDIIDTISTVMLLNSVEARMWKPVLREIFCKHTDFQTCSKANYLLKEEIFDLASLSKNKNNADLIKNKEKNLCLCNNHHPLEILRLPEQEKRELSMQLIDYKNIPDSYRPPQRNRRLD